MTRSWIRETLVSIVADLGSLGDSEVVSLDQADVYQWRVELVYRELLAREVVGGLDNGEREALPIVAEAYSRMVQVLEDCELAVPESSQALVILDGHVGRPRFNIPFRQLEHLVSSNFSVPQIAGIVNVSVRTIRRRMLEYNLTIRGTYSNMSDVELDEIAEVQQQFPSWGNRQMYGYFVSRGIRLQFERVRESQCRVDPEGSMLRRLHHLRRRRYCVHGPQHLWHLDGNHKLIRYIPVIGIYVAG